MKADLASRRSAVIVIPRMEVSNVTYAPLFSPQGRPIGLTIAYDARFSDTGQFNPGVGVEAKYDNDRWHSQTRMEGPTAPSRQCPARPSPPSVQ